MLGIWTFILVAACLLKAKSCSFVTQFWKIAVLHEVQIAFFVWNIWTLNTCQIDSFPFVSPNIYWIELSQFLSKYVCRTKQKLRCMDLLDSIQMKIRICVKRHGNSFSVWIYRLHRFLRLSFCHRQTMYTHTYTRVHNYHTNAQMR